MRGRLLGVLLASIPFGMPGAEPPDTQASEAITLIVNARQNGTMDTSTVRRRSTAGRWRSWNRHPARESESDAGVERSG
jgi:hypothetical protein